MADQNYYPALSSLISFEDLPLDFNFTNDFFDHIFYQNLRIQKSLYGEKALYQVEIISDSLSLNFGDDGFELIVNPNNSSNTESIIPIEFFYQWEILKYIGEFDSSTFSFGNESYFNLIVDFLKIDPNDILLNAIEIFIHDDPNQSKVEKFVSLYNSFSGNQVILQQTADFNNIISQLSVSSIDIISLIYQFFVENTVDNIYLNIEKLFANWLGSFSVENLKKLVIPSFGLTIDSLSLGLGFPRTWLKPVDATGEVIEGDSKSMLTFEVGSLTFDSKNGFDFVNANTFSFTRSQIGDTGLILDLTGIKIDLSKGSNIPEAADRPLDFMGVYVEEAEIILPPKWFAEATSSATAPKIFAKNLLIGSGGMSGTVGLEGDGSLKYTFVNGLTLELVSFDIVFESGAIIGSSILGHITIPEFAHNPLSIKLDIENGFKVQVLVPQGSGIPVIDNSNILLTLDGLTIGRQEAVWELGFAARFLMKRNIPMLSKVFPQKINVNNFLFKSDGSEIDYNFRIDWESGFYIQGSNENGVTAYFPLNKKIAGELFKIDGLQLGVNADTANSEIDFEILLRGVSFDLGPINGGVDSVGTKLTVKKQESGGNLGAFNAALSFIGPKGISLSIDASPISGGGFLYIDEPNGMYSGGLELKFSSISFKAIGIINTKLPSGAKGYSVLVVITAEFSPIQLGMGFTLNGLGGIMGLNRTMDPDFLRKGIQGQTLDSILFPKGDIVKNSNTIISNLSQAFPIKEGQFLIGPMAKIGWGGGTNLLTIDLGIIIELPEPIRLAILGVLRALIPTKEDAILTLQINFLGVIDFTNKYLSFDASLYDSSILKFALTGDMALRLYWGDKPNFLLSVGGFHPKYTPPPLNLPQLNRLAISLASDSNLNIRAETYFAITSNSVQFGAKVMATAKAWKIQAVGALWFDILFQFKPFYFNADMGAMFAIKMGSKELLSIYIDLSLEGPNPWHAQGMGKFKILFVKVTVHFDKTFGTARPEVIETVTTQDKLQAAIADRDNWQTFLPERNSQLVAYRAIDPTDTNLQVDPSGSLIFSQKLLPLNLSLSKFGTAGIKDFNKYSIDPGAINGANGGSLYGAMTQDFFARNEFFYMKDEEKLSKDAYEKFDSGFSLTTAGALHSGTPVHRLSHYEEIFIDSGMREKKTPFKTLTALEFNNHMFANYVNRSALSKFEKVTPAGGPLKTSVAEGQYILATKSDFSQSTWTSSFTSYTEAEHYLASIQASNPTVAAGLMVANKFELG